MRTFNNTFFRDAMMAGNVAAVWVVDGGDLVVRGLMCLVS